MNEKEIIAKLQLLREIKPEKEWVAVTKEKIIPQKRQSMWELFNYFGSKVFRPELRPAFAMSVFLAVIMGIALFGLISIDKTQAPVISINPNVNFNDPSEYLALAEKKIQEIEKIAQDDGDGRIVGILQDTQKAIEKAARALPPKPENPEKTKEIVRKVAEINKKAQEIKRELGVEIDSSVLTSKTEEMIKNGIKDTTQELAHIQIQMLENSSLTEKQQELFEEAKMLYNQGKYQEALEKILILTNISEEK
ncbi:hypothetical protein J7K92_01070 [bacterium]|nr:hypothetical protein [bacterium]